MKKKTILSLCLVCFFLFKAKAQTIVDFTTMNKTQLYDTGLILSDGSLGTYDGSEQVLLDNNLWALWAGNARNIDNKVKYSGINADPSAIQSQLMPYGGVEVSPVYFSGDINMDGKAKYSGVSNDSAIINYVIINKYPNNLVQKNSGFDFMIEQIPIP